MSSSELPKSFYEEREKPDIPKKSIGFWAWLIITCTFVTIITLLIYGTSSYWMPKLKRNMQMLPPQFGHSKEIIEFDALGKSVSELQVFQFEITEKVKNTEMDMDVTLDKVNSLLERVSTLQSEFVVLEKSFTEFVTDHEKRRSSRKSSVKKHSAKKQVTKNKKVMVLPSLVSISSVGGKHSATFRFNGESSPLISINDTWKKWTLTAIDSEGKKAMINRQGKNSEVIL